MKTAIIIVLLSSVALTLSAAKITGPISANFEKWLQANGYGADNFLRRDLGSSGSFGGKTDDNQKIVNQPVVFVHGNSDLALQRDASSTYQTGWDQTTAFFMKEGYTAAELYGTTYGPAQSGQALQQTHNCEYVRHIRRFIEAVLTYTNASKIDVIGHSMGVTIARRALKGGTECNLGAPLTNKVDTLLGLAGANYGLCTCQYATFTPTCNEKNGFFPGKCGSQSICGITLEKCDQTQYSSFMENLNSDPTREAENVFAFWSNSDEILGQGSMAFGKVTSRIPNMNGSKVYNSLNHMGVKDKTGADQIKAVRDHLIDSTDLPGGGGLPGISLPGINLPTFNLPDMSQLIPGFFQSISDYWKNLMQGR